MADDTQSPPLGSSMDTAYGRSPDAQTESPEAYHLVRSRSAQNFTNRMGSAGSQSTTELVQRLQQLEQKYQDLLSRLTKLENTPISTHGGITNVSGVLKNGLDIGLELPQGKVNASGSCDDSGNVTLTGTVAFNT